MEPLKPSTPEALAEALAEASREGRSITLGGAFTKRRMTAPPAAENVTLSTVGLDRILDYEPADLTISVEAGMPFSSLIRRITEDGLMLPLDPPFFDETTVGGVVAANVSGPRRRGFGTARDTVIGMTFSTVDGKLVKAGGMVVKNAAGLEMGKLMIGSMGALAAIASVNFRLAPRPPHTRTFAISSPGLAEAVEARDSLVRGVLQPAAIDLLNPAAARRIGFEGYLVLTQAAGSQSVVERYSAELTRAEVFDGNEEEALWTRVREFTPTFLARQPESAVARVSTTISGISDVMRISDEPAVARAGSGVVYIYFDDCRRAGGWIEEAVAAGLRPIMEYIPESGCSVNRWPVAGSDFAMIEKIKQMFDPKGLLNPGRLYGRL